MKKEREILLIIKIILLVILMAGCDKYQNHKVLTFFFTGVPPVESENLTVDGELPSFAIEKETKKALPEKERKAAIHGPYDAGQCYQCHIIASKSSMVMQGGVPSFESLPRKLRLPKNEICLECHTTKSFMSAFTRDLWIHGPVSTGMCTVCHHYHKSANSFMLLKATSIELCSMCHVKEAMSNIDEHSRNLECTVCHNPHVGKDRYLLKEEFFEIF